MKSQLLRSITVTGLLAVFCLAAGHHWSFAVVLGLLFYVVNNLVYALFKL